MTNVERLNEMSKGWDAFGFTLAEGLGPDDVERVAGDIINVIELHKAGKLKESPLRNMRYGLRKKTEDA